MDSLAHKDQQYIWHPFTPYTEVSKVIPLSHAQGVYLYTAEGREILDAISSWWVNLHGHSHPHIAQSLATQALKLEHVIFAGFTHEPAVTLAERLLAILPDNQEKIFYSDNGSTACEVGIKMAFQYWHNQGIRKPRIVALDGGYHGDTFGAMSVGDRSPFSAPFDPYLFEVYHLPFPTCSQSPCCGASQTHHQDCARAAQVIAEFETLAATGEVGAFIYEPLIQGASGMRMYSPEILDKLLGIAARYDIITIADEVMTGFGRTGKLFASEYCTLKPDILCLSKGLTGGTLALGVTSCTGRIFEAFKAAELAKTFFHGHSFTANPLACAAANASLDLLLTANCQRDIERISAKQAAFAQTMRQHPAIRQARHFGTIVALEIDTDRETSYFNEARSWLYDYFLSKDILLRPLGNVLYVLPPYIITNEELERIYRVIGQLLDERFGA
ncbi:adenosylmethionine--8-amino-7-oxononanoate transaminase [Eisenibacter elegans]|jgi:adenosylmethionine-8-amino-7-oxononanoate aminotransferase|uniref:adenosylmethionine--8-amino-7-oxononanoate transaminase n=1 Tax=Eisenibacter elegans TaxID=997 RepID=UPI000554C81E|nr:adenosylmethionine--8-amino-7-oxononanoate transaminase [Eisenibacter elegans]